MTISLHFLGWEKGCLSAASDFLLSSSRRSFDLSALTLVVPVSRAGRRLSELLAIKAGENGRGLLTPKILTVGQLPELFYKPSKTVLSESAQLILRGEALQEADSISALVSQPPKSSAIVDWYPLARTVQQIYSELSGAALHFKDVADRVGSYATPEEEARWQVLAQVQEIYQAKLASCDSTDKHLARFEALYSGRLSYEGPLYLVACADLNEVSRQMLKLAEAKITSLVFAPEEERERFDDLGCIRVDRWRETLLPIPDDSIHVCSTAADQSAKLVERIYTSKPLLPAAQISIGAVDDAILPRLEEHLREAKLSAHSASGRKFGSLPVFQLLRGVTDYLSTTSFAAFAALVRHPAWADWLAQCSEVGAAGATEKLLSTLDAFQEQFLQAKAPSSAANEAAPVSDWQTVSALVAASEKLLKDFRGAARPLSQWPSLIADLLENIFAASQQPSEEGLLERALEKIGSKLSELSALPRQADPAVSGADALAILLAELSGASVAPDAASDVIEILGWLELALDDARRLYIVGMNEGVIPESINHDPFLPNTLRRALGLVDNERRYARDAYALLSMLRTKERVDFILGQTNERGDQVLPSRLLYACPESELPKRVEKLFGCASQPAVIPALLLRSAVAKDLFAIPPKPVLRPAARVIPITSLRAYLECPYRYYLRYRELLKSQTDQELELSPLGFGSLAHDVLCAFGSDREAKELTDAEKIFKFLKARLQLQFERRFGKSALPAVAIQHLQLEQRLRAFAEWQAAWRAAGWEIAAVERPINAGQFSFELGSNSSFSLTGRMDRIDRNLAQNEIVIFDYKTSDSAKQAREAHLKRDEWIDLQLPAYEIYARRKDKQHKISSGYINLSAKPDEVKEDIAAWSEAELVSAENKIREVGEKIVAGVFWPPSSEVKLARDDFAYICGTLLIAPSGGEDLEGGAE